MTATKIQVRRDSSTNWSTANPVLSEGEIGLDLTSMQFKMGDGSSNWASLEYYGAVESDTEPSAPQNGDMWVDTSACPPELKIYSNCGVSDGWNTVGNNQFTTVTLSPLSLTIDITASNTIVAVTDLSTILPNSTIIFEWYRYDNSTGFVGQTLLQTKTDNSSLTDTYQVTGADQGKYIGCTVKYLGTVISETQRSQINVAAVPVANMHGLRFDWARKTNLVSSCGNLDNWTCSVWLKQTLYNQNGYFWSQGADVGFNIDQNGSVQFWNGASQLALSDVGVVAPNTWTHVVLTCSEYENKIKCYVNGNYTGYIDGTLVVVDSFVIGKNNADNNFDGYMSDYYFVNDKVCPPETFGKEFALGWGPLDSSEVEANLFNIDAQPGPSQPYDSRANTDQVWSDGCVDGPSMNNSDGTAAFNGSLSLTSYSTSQGGYFDINFATPVTFTDKVEVIFYGSSSPSGSVEFNRGEDSSYTDNYNVSGVADGKVVAQVTSAQLDGDTLQNLRMSAVTGNNGITGIKIDGRLLVDSDVWNNSQNWSDAVSGPAVGWNTSGNILQNGFDGNPATLANANGAGGTMVFSPNLGNGSFDVEIQFGNDQLYAQTTIDGVAPGSTENSNLIGKWTGISSFNVLTMNADGLAANARCCFNYIKVNGAYLVDSGAQWNTDEVWSKDMSKAPNSADTGVPKFAFDGDATTAYGSSTSGSPGSNPITFTPSIPIPYSSGVEIINPSGQMRITLNDGPNIDYTGTSQVIATGSGTIEKITISEQRAFAGFQFNGIKVDDAWLVDPQVPWNTGQIWSDLLELSNPGAGSNPKETFNGELDITDASGATLITDGGNATATGTLPITLNDSNVRVYLKWNDGQSSFSRLTAGNQQTTSINYMSSGSNATGYAEVSGATGSDITVEFTFDTGGGTTNYIKGYEVDGDLLVDGGFGENGFYLPFDPAQTGANYSSNFQLINGADYKANQGPELAFNGIRTSTLGTNRSTAILQTSNATLELVFDTPIDIGPNSYCFMGASVGGSVFQIVDSTNTQVGDDIPIPTGEGTLVPLPASSDVTYLRWNSNGVNGDGVGFGYLIINGETLVDHSSIGVDMSGNKNNFYDQNFTVEVKPPVTGVISSYNDNSKKFTAQDPFIHYLPYPPIDGVSKSVDPPTDYYLSASNPTNGSAVSAEVNFTTPFTGYVYVTGSTNGRYRFDGGDWMSVSQNNYYWNKVLLNGVSKVEAQSTDNDQFGGLGPVYTNDDEQVMFSLPDTLQIKDDDTVLDTPMKNYAVLDSSKKGSSVTLKNGNLGFNGSGQESVLGTVGVTDNGSFYYEYISNSNESNVGIGASDMELTQYVGQTNKSYGYYGPNGALYYNNTNINQGKTYGDGDLIGVAYDNATSKLALFVNGEFSTETDVSDELFYPAIGIASMNGNINFGQQEFVAPNVTHNMVDGNVFIGGYSNQNSSQVWSSNTNGQFHGAGPVLIFDGSTSTATWTINNDRGIVNFTGLTNVTSLRVFFATGTSYPPNPYEITVNGTDIDISDLHPKKGQNNSQQWVDVSSALPANAELQAIKLSATGQGSLHAIEVNGRLLVNDPNPEYNNSEFWSGRVNTSASGGSVTCTGKGPF